MQRKVDTRIRVGDHESTTRVIRCKGFRWNEASRFVSPQYSVLDLVEGQYVPANGVASTPKDPSMIEQISPDSEFDQGVEYKRVVYVYPKR